MPIVEHSPKACFNKFARHLHNLFATVLGIDEQVRHLPPTEHAESGSWLTKVGIFDTSGLPKAVRLQTQFGPIFLSIDQLVCAVAEDRKYRLETHSYAYKLSPNEEWETAALIRWEYEKHVPSTSPPRHHVQFAAKAAHNGDFLDLNRLHTPSGWVTLEEVLRFLITDLRVTSACNDWDKRLGGSEGRFYNDFTSKRYTRAGHGPAHWLLSKLKR